MYVNQKVEKTQDSGCCRECDSFKVTISGTPHSFVEINSKTNEKQVIGNPESFPSPLILSPFFPFFCEIKGNRREFKNQQQQLMASI